MSATGRQESCVLEDPNAVRHMDALFDVLRKPGTASSGGSTTRSTATSAADLVRNGPGGDVEFFLDALFSVVQQPGSGGRRSSATSTNRNQGTAKTWKERELPASFFDAAGGSTSDNDKPDGDQCKQEKAFRNGATEAPNDPPDPPSELKPQEITSSAGSSVSPLPVVLVANTNTTPAESLTFYIDKHLQCRVNMEPAIERRRRLARGRVQKYRSIKKRCRQRKGDSDAIENT